MEIKPNKVNRYNKPVVGLAIGLLLPLVSLFIYYFVMSAKNEGLDIQEFFNILNQKNVLVPILSLCVLPNLIPFFVFKKKDHWYAIKGIVTSVFIYLILVIVLKFI
jgi:hypothetical protein